MITRKKLGWAAVPTVTAIVLTFATALFLLTHPRVSVHNIGTEPMRGVRVLVTGHSYAIGDCSRASQPLSA